MTYALDVLDKEVQKLIANNGIQRKGGIGYESTEAVELYIYW